MSGWFVVLSAVEGFEVEADDDDGAIRQALVQVESRVVEWQVEEVEKGEHDGHTQAAGEG